MKRTKARTNFTSLEHLSFTIHRINQDASGKQMINRTYWSTRKKISQPDENSSNLMHKDSKVTDKNPHCNKSKEPKSVEKITQLFLFPH